MGCCRRFKLNGFQFTLKKRPESVSRWKNPIIRILLNPLAQKIKIKRGWFFLCEGCSKRIIDISHRSGSFNCCTFKVCTISNFFELKLTITILFSAKRTLLNRKVCCIAHQNVLSMFFFISRVFFFVIIMLEFHKIMILKSYKLCRNFIMNRKKLQITL